MSKLTSIAVVPISVLLLLLLCLVGYLIFRKPGKATDPGRGA